ncbi:hypothetical protein BS78_07G203200 [Paspalum vaginatum]|nr:hypothetical protein BS78_07G203200 [Paspalum vaginatum]
MKEEEVEVVARRKKRLPLPPRDDVVVDEPQPSKPEEKKKRRKRGRVELRRIEDRTSRQVRFSKRRSGLFKKAHELSVLCEARVALVVLSPAGRLYHFASAGSSIEEIFDQYWDLANTAIDLNIEARDSRVNCSIQNDRSAGGSLYGQLIVIAERAIEADLNELDMAEKRGLEEALTDALAVIKNKLMTKGMCAPET